MNPGDETRIERLGAGTVQPMPGDGRPTAIFKQPVDSAEVGALGLVTDYQADKRVHGGPEKAVHQFPQANYARLAAVFPDFAEQLLPGAMGENLSTPDWDESDVCIGDVFEVGGAQLQLCQPRQPCWKIDARFGADGMTRYIAEQGLAGWYFRVLKPGVICSGDPMRLLQRNPEPITVREFWQLRDEPRPPLARLQALQRTPGLATQWQKKLSERIEWLRANA